MPLFLGGAQPRQSSPMNRAGESPAHENDVDSALPALDEYALAAYDVPSEGRERRRAQDEAAEGSQDVGEVFD